MSKKIKVIIENDKELIFSLLEDGKKGDTINLMDNDKIDFRKIEQKINENKDEFFNKKLILKIEEERKKFEEERKNIQLNYENLLYKKDNEQLKIINDAINQKNEEINELKNQLQMSKEKLLFKLKELEFKKMQEFEIEKKKINSEINSLKNEKILMEKMQEERIANANEKLKNDLNIKYLNEINLKNEEIEIWKEKEQNLNDKISQLTREKSSNQKLLGEDLEKWIFDEFQKSFSFNEDIKIKKDNIAIENSKADFIVSYKDKPIITIEAKTESQLSIDKNRKKNEHHFPKLDKDSKNNNTQYALLVSELEIDRNIYIEKISQYKNMFLMRPVFLISFINIAMEIAKKEYNIEQKIKRENIQFENADLIMDNFRNMKDEILNNSIKNIEQQIKKSIQLVESIKKNAEGIENAQNLILETHLSSLKNKINNFKIKKIVKKIEEFKEEEERMIVSEIKREF
ncbi:MAG: DUF2130 domain-containing protein [Metamycoplasmataceae bacterium]